MLPGSWDPRGNLNARPASDNPLFVGIPKVRPSESLLNKNRLEIKSSPNSDSLKNTLANCPREVNSLTDKVLNISDRDDELHVKENITSKIGLNASDTTAQIENTHVKSALVKVKIQEGLFAEKLKLNNNKYRRTADKEKVSERKEIPINAAQVFETVIGKAGTQLRQPTEDIGPKKLRDKPIQQMQGIDAAGGRDTHYQQTAVSTKAIIGEVNMLNNV